MLIRTMASLTQTNIVLNVVYIGNNYVTPHVLQHYKLDKTRRNSSKICLSFPSTFTPTHPKYDQKSKLRENEKSRQTLTEI